MIRTFCSRLRLYAVVTLILASCLIFARWSMETPQTEKPTAPKASGKTSAGTAPVQSQRNIGKAYYEQGKYTEAIAEFQNVVASVKALATDHFDLGLALMQANKQDEALGELTTAKQMDSKLVAADYNLGILYKRELRYPDAEAALRRVIAADPGDPAAWFNLGDVCFAEKRLEDALAAYQHVANMGFGQGQNFYVAALFHTFTTNVRLKRDEDAQKALKIHEKMRDKVPTISLQNPALEGGKYGAILLPAVPPAEPGPSLGLEKVTFADISGQLGLTFPASQAPSANSQGPINAADYSLDYARRNLVPLFGPSLAFGDYNGDGRTDIYIVNPGGANHLLRNNGDGTFTDVTEKAGVAGTGADVSATFADYKQRQRFPGFGVRHTRGRALHNSRNGRDLRLHVAQAHAVAANFDEVAGAAFDPQISVAITSRQVARLQPAATELLLRRLRLIQIPRAHRRPAHLNLARLALGDFASLVIDHAHDHIVERNPGAAQFFFQPLRREA